MGLEFQYRHLEDASQAQQSCQWRYFEVWSSTLFIDIF